MGCYHGNAVGDCLGCQVAELTTLAPDEPLIAKIGELQLRNRKLERDLDAATMFEFKGDEDIYFVETFEDSDGWDVSHLNDEGETVYHAEGVSREEALAVGRKMAGEDDA